MILATAGNQDNFMQMKRQDTAYMTVTARSLPWFHVPWPAMQMALSMLLLMLASSAHAALDMSTLVQVGAGDATVAWSYKYYNRDTKVSTYQITVTNPSARTIKGPMYVVLDAVSGTLVEPVSPTGTTTTGKPYYRLGAVDILPGGQLIRKIGFSNLANTRLSIASTLYSTPPGPAIDTNLLARAAPDQVPVKSTFKAYNNTTFESRYEVTVTNSSGQKLKGPVYVVIEALRGTGVVVKNAVGTTQGGLPYFRLTSGDMSVAAVRTFPLILANPGNVRVGFTPAVYYQPTVSALSVVITRPASLITVGSTPLAIEGTVNDSAATLTVNGAPVAISGGRFQASVALTEGHNAIVARAIKGLQEATATISVSLDLTPPYLTVDSPAADSTVTTKFITVSGLVNDIVRGTVSEGQANVTVNGKAASVANRTYVAEEVELAEGPNTLTIRGSDQVGNTAEVQSRVIYKVPGARRIEEVSGGSQRALIRATLGQPLQVRLIDELGGVEAGKAVVFRVADGDGEVGVGQSDQGQAVLVQSDADGVAQTRFRVGTRAGNGNNRVTAKAVGFDGQVDFFASADPRPGDKVSVNSGNNQRGAANQPLPLPFVVVVTDDGSNVLKDQAVRFEVTEGGGKFQNGQTTYTATTDSDGRAGATLTLGGVTGLDSQRVVAKLVGTELYAGFTASALASGDPGQTAVSGVVLDNQDHPLPGVTVRVEGTTRQAKTNAQGQFRVTEVPVGPVHLIVDGSTTTVPGEWPTLPYNIVTVAGSDNPLSTPVYMVKLDTERSVWVGKEDKVLTVPELPGFELTVKKGSVTFPNGDREGYLSVTPVNASKVPMAPPNGMQPQLIVTIQPTGARFDPPAPLQLPNVDGHAPGARVEMYSFDHDLEEFVTIGLGTVSADGRVITSNPGVGVIKAGWHCGSQPTGAGCASNCGECKKCDGNCNCVQDNSQTPSSIQNAKFDCKKPICLGGAPFQTADDSDFDQQCSSGCSNGSPEAKPDGGDCDDGQFCTDPDQCKGGACTGEKIADQDQGTVEFELKLDPILEGINSFGRLMGVLKTIDVTFTESGNKKLICCEAKQQKDVEVKTLQFGLNGKLETDKIFVPALSFNIRVVRIGVFVKLGVAANANLKGENDFCADKQCWGGGVGVSGGAEGGVAAEDAAKVVSLSGSLASALKLDGNVNCRQVDYGLSHDGLKGKLAVELFDGFVSLNYQVELVAPGPISQGVIPLDI